MKLHRPSPSMAVALVALVFSMTGTGIAAEHYLITSKSEIKPSVLAQLKGNRGPAGAIGASGAQGLPGQVIIGPEGRSGISIQGPEGKEGPNGLIGPVGSQGLTGVIGPQGPTGPEGANSTVPGPKGEIGPEGPKGTTGATGPEGGLSSIEIVKSEPSEGNAEAQCGGNRRLIGGGGSVVRKRWANGTFQPEAYISSSAPDSEVDSWRVFVTPVPGSTNERGEPGGETDAIAYAICVE